MNEISETFKASTTPTLCNDFDRHQSSSTTPHIPYHTVFTNSTFVLETGPTTSLTFNPIVTTTATISNTPTSTSLGPRNSAQDVSEIFKGIGIGVAAAVLAASLGFGSVWLYKKKRNRQSRNANDGNNMELQNM
jgi:hypothetical protein